MKFFTILLFLFITNIHIAQESEYMVTKNNDTIYGSITRSFSFFNKENVIFKIEDETGKKSKIDVSEVKSLRLLNGSDGDSYIATVYGKLYLKRIIDGEIKVYELLSFPFFFISKNDSEINSTDIGFPFARKESHLQIRQLIKDDPELLEEFNTMEGSEKNIFYIIKKYNNSKIK